MYIFISIDEDVHILASATKIPNVADHPDGPETQTFELDGCHCLQAEDSAGEVSSAAPSAAPPAAPPATVKEPSAKEEQAGYAFVVTVYCHALCPADQSF